MKEFSRIENSIRRFVLKLPNRSLLIIICILIGIVAGISAFLLRSTLQFVQNFIKIFGNQNISNFLLVLLPIAGLFLTVTYVRIFHKKLGLKKGISQILYSIKNNSSIIEANQMYGHIISSSLTVGFGGSAGFEAPIVATGSAIGSNIARYFKFAPEERALLLASGAAAGISAIFNAPVAGVLFAIEVLLVDMSVSSFVPLLLCSATAAVVSKILFHDQLFVLISNDWRVRTIPLYMLLGVLAGLYSVFIIRQTLFINRIFGKIRNVWVKAAIGGLLLSALIVLFPSLFGEGYNSIQHILDLNVLFPLNDKWFDAGKTEMYWAIMALLFAKVYATSFTISSGGNGGIFAPSLFMGGVLGYIFAKFINSTGIIELPVVYFIVAGMAGILSGVIKIPLTAVFLIAEITGGYVLFVPLMIVSASSFYISSYFEHRSIYRIELELIERKLKKTAVPS
ncbi:MAG: chloride channel protein [Saprospiraceae bacterium]